MKKIIKKLNISKSEWKFVFLLTAIIIIITTLPYLYAHFQSSKNQIYNGLHILTSGDTHVYFSYLEQIKQGNYLFKNLFTSETTMPVLNIFWLTAGLFGKLFNLGNILNFHIVRILLIPLCVISLYFLISYLFDSKQTRKISLVFSLFSSGLGAWASLLLPAYINNKTLFYWPMDLWTPENNFFLTLYHSPHIIASLALMILFFFLFLKSTEENKTSCSILAGLCGMLLIQFHPFHLPTIVLVPTFYLLAKWALKGVELPIGNSTPIKIKINWQDLKHLFIIFIITSPAALYYAWLVKFDWATKLKAFQNVCYTPRFFTVLISYGGLLIFSLIAIFLFIKYFINKKHENLDIKNIISKNKFLFIVVWAITQFTLIFMPFRFQRRLTQGLQIPLAILTIIAILYLKERFKNSEINKIFFNKYILITIFIIFFAMSNLLLVIDDIKRFANNDELFYFSKQQLESYEFLKNEARVGEIILSGIINGNAIPAVAGRQVYFGHNNIETLNFDSKSVYLKWFFKNNLDNNKKLNFLKKNNIKYIYYSKHEKKLGNFNPENKNYLNKIYSNDFATIYKVI
jgi:hypothetical protein